MLLYTVPLRNILLMKIDKYFIGFRFILESHVVEDDSPFYVWPDV